MIRVVDISLRYFINFWRLLLLYYSYYLAKTMRSFNLDITHKLSQHEALSRIKNLFTILRLEQKDKISEVKESWQNETVTFQFAAMGFTVSGILTVHPLNIELNAKVPFAVFLFRNKIKKVIREKAMELFAE